jgi:glutamate carboxypeptidase
VTRSIPPTGIGDAHAIARAAADRLRPLLPAYLHDLEVLVNTDSGTYDREDVQRVGAWIRARCEAWPASCMTQPGGEYGDSLAFTLQGEDAANIAILTHMDTVFPTSTAAQRSFHIEGSRAYGPGVCDMKAGIISAIHAVETLRDVGFSSFGRLVLVCTSDEEVGAPSSRAFIEATAAGAEAVFVLEAGRENGDIVGQRKGGGVYRLTVQGRSAHAGVEPQKGRSAILTLARQTVALHALTDFSRGTTVNVGQITGGTRPNVVPDHAEALVDIRVNTLADAEQLLASADAALAAAALEGTTYTWAPIHFRPPWELNSGTANLTERAQSIAASLGFSVRAAATGGTSDGNFTAALGIPTLDGLGPVGGLDHSPLEYVEIESIVPRTALLAGLIASVCLAQRERE